MLLGFVGHVGPGFFWLWLQAAAGEQVNTENNERICVWRCSDFKVLSYFGCLSHSASECLSESRWSSSQCVSAMVKKLLQEWIWRSSSFTSKQTHSLQLPLTRSLFSVLHQTTCLISMFLSSLEASARSLVAPAVHPNQTGLITEERGQQQADGLVDTVCFTVSSLS